MPTYEYECTNGHHFEVEQSIKDEPLKRCKVCRAKVQRLISASHFILKGGGWYADGYGNKKSGGDAKSESKSESKPESKSESKSETKSEAKSEGKPKDGKAKGKGGSGSAAAAS